MRRFAAATLAALLTAGPSAAAVLASYSAEVSAGVTLTGARYLGTGIAAYDSLLLTGWDDDGDQYLFEDGFGRMDSSNDMPDDWETGGPTTAYKGWSDRIGLRATGAVPRPGDGFAYSEGVYYHRPAIRYDTGLCASALCAAGRDVVLTFDYALQVAARASAQGIAGRETAEANAIGQFSLARLEGWNDFPVPEGRLDHRLEASAAVAPVPGSRATDSDRNSVEGTFSLALRPDEAVAIDLWLDRAYGLAVVPDPVPAVPLPASLPMFAVGVLLAGGLGRRWAPSSRAGFTVRNGRSIAM